MVRTWSRDIGAMSGAVHTGVKNIDDGLQFLFSFSFYLLVFFISRLFSIFRTRVRVK